MKHFRISIFNFEEFIWNTETKNLQNSKWKILWIPRFFYFFLNLNNFPANQKKILSNSKWYVLWIPTDFFYLYKGNFTKFWQEVLPNNERRSSVVRGRHLLSSKRENFPDSESEFFQIPRRNSPDFQNRILLESNRKDILNP